MQKILSKIQFLNFNSYEFERYFKNTFWLFLEKGLRISIGFIVSIYLARYLGPTQYGTLNYSLSFVYLFYALATLGLDQIVVKSVIDHPESKDKILATSFWLRIIGSLLAVILIGIIIQWTPNDLLTKGMILIIASGMIFQSFNIIDLYFQSQVLSRHVVLVQIIQVIFSAALKLLFIAWNADLIWFAIAIFIDNMTLAAGLLFIYSKREGGLKLELWDFDQAVQLLKRVLPLILAILAVTFYMRIDQILIKEMLGVKEVGIYAICVQLCEIWNIIPAVLASSLFPALIKIKKTDLELYKRRIQNFYDFLVILSVIIIIPILIFADNIIEIFFGKAYISSIYPLRIYILGNIFSFLGIASSYWRINENLEKITFYISLAAAVINIILNLLFIPIWGISGAALAMLITLFFNSYLADLLFKSTLVSFTIKTKSLLLENVIKKLLRKF